MSERRSKHIASFDYFDKSLIVLSATNGSISIASFATVIGTPVGIASAGKIFAFSLSTLSMLARSKLSSIESKISEALMNNEISHEDFLKSISEERNYKEFKENFSMMKGQEDKKIDID